jgi:hypothetical protein
MLISSTLIMSFENQKAPTDQNATKWPGDILYRACNETNLMQYLSSV